MGTTVRTLVLVVAVLVVSLSLPHFSLWNFGVGDAYAAETIDGIQCNAQKNSGKVGCWNWDDQYGIMTCLGTWAPSSRPDELNLPDLATCNSKCQSVYGQNCLTQSGTGSPNVLINSFSANPSSIRTGDSVTIAFAFTGGSVTLNKKPRSGQQETIGTYSSSPVSIPEYPTETTDYILVASATNQQIRTVTITQTTSTNQQNKPYCCVSGNGPYNYVQVSSQTECTSGQRYQPQPCSQIETGYCVNKCSSGHYSGGSCQPAPPNTPDSPGRYNNVCMPGNICVCGAQDPNQLRLAQSCQQACSYSSPYGSYALGATPYGSGSALSIPQGVCTDNPNSLGMFVSVATTVGSTATAGQAGTSRPPYPADNPPARHDCELGKTCWCVTYNINTVTAQQQQQVTLPAVVPGTECTTPHQWCNPDALDNKPTAAAGEHDCVAAVNATITASFGTVSGNGTNQAQITGIRLIQAGEPVTIIGTVTKTTDRCLGYNYTCERMQELTCNEDGHGLWTTLSYKDCPTGTTQIHAEGDGRHANWRTIAAIAAAVAAGVSMGAASPALAAILESIRNAAIITAATGTMEGFQCDSGQASGGASNLGIQMTALLQQGRSGQNTATATNAVDIANAANAAGAAAGANYLAFAEQAIARGDHAAAETYMNLANVRATEAANGVRDAAGSGAASGISSYGAGLATSYALSQLPACPSAQDVSDCFSVCGKTYTTAVSAAPSCSAGGPVIRADPTTYRCGMDSCGGFAGKVVRIQVIGPDGSTVRDETTTAGADGEFSYTFTAPAADGEFTAVVSAPR